MENMYNFAILMAHAESPLPPAGRLTTGLFHMKRSYARWREYGAPGWLLIYTLGGIGRIGLQQDDLLLDKGDLVLIAPTTRNDYGLEQTHQRWNLLWAYFFPRAEWHELLNWPEVSPGISKLHLQDAATQMKFYRRLKRVHDLNVGPKRRREFFAMNSLENFLLDCDEVNPEWEKSRLDPRVLLAMNWLCQNLDQKTKLSSIARRCGISVSRLTHLFREQSGRTVGQFHDMQRIVRARQLLEMTQGSVAAIANEVGFPDPFHFSRRFKQYLGVSPQMYRRNYLSGTAQKWGTE
ncbi:MAG: arabinose operon transcriptional regulator AraC [Terriglobia bacterium]